MNKEELFKGLKEEQINKIKSFKNNEDILSYLKEEGIELNDDLLEAIAGGIDLVEGRARCPFCSSLNTTKSTLDRYICNNCGEFFV